MAHHVGPQVLLELREMSRLSQLKLLLCSRSFVFPALTLLFCAACSPAPIPQPAGSGQSPAPRRVTVAAASDLKFAFDELIAAFEAEHSAVAVTAAYGSSGNFYAMIRNRAPFDIFFSADIEYPQRLAEDGLGIGDVFPYATGRIVLWVTAESGIEVERAKMDSLLDPSVRRIAVANPRHAPYGRAAEEAMKTLKVYDRVRLKLVFGENVTQTMQFVQSGAADIGIVALSLADSPQLRGQGRYWKVPLDAHSKMVQGGLVLKRAADVEAAMSFREYVLSDSGRALLARYGLILPDD
jgi:molybdate transport system substrate-binding protein